MKKIKVSEATGPVLDYLVAKCEGVDGEAARLFHDEGHYNYSTDWSQGGPLIERECIGFEWMASEWKAAQNYAGAPYKDAPSMRPIGERHLCYGPTPLIAAMRCYVASKLGDVVDVPEELV